MIAKTAWVPQPHSPRVVGWIRGALNPLIEGLAIERALLEGESMIWTRGHGLELIRPPIEYLFPNGRILLQDLIETAAPELESPLTRHAELVAALDAAFAATVEDLLATEGFRARVRRTAERSPRVFQGWNEGDFAELPGSVAQRLANDVRALPRDGLAEWWERVHPELYADPSLDAVLASVRRARGAVLTDTPVLSETLTSTRTALCDQYDVAPAAVPGIDD